MKLASLKAILVLASISLGGCAGRSPSFDVLPTTQGFKQDIQYNNKMDVLWVVDDTDSMAGHRKAVAKQFERFLDAFVSKKLDIHLAVTTTDMRLGKGAEGAFIGDGVVKGNDVDAKKKFARTMNVTNSSGAQEQGLLAMKTALSPELLSTINAGFLRDSATLVLVFLTNENDHSVPSAVSGYVDFLNQLKPKQKYGARGWVANFIGITDSASTCTSAGSVPEVGLRYMDLVTASKGQSESVCAEDLTQVVSRLQRRVENMITEFHLDRAPQISTISVRIDGRLVPEDEENGWTYEDEDRVVRFHGDAIPAADSSVEIEFKQRAA